MSKAIVCAPMCATHRFMSDMEGWMELADLYVEQNE